MSRYRTTAEDEAEQEVGMALWQLAVGALERECPKLFTLWWECEEGATPAALARRMGADPAYVAALVAQAEALLLDLHGRMERLVARAERQAARKAGAA